MGFLGAIRQAVLARAGNEVNKRAFPIGQKIAAKAGVSNEYARAYAEQNARAYKAKVAGSAAADKRAEQVAKFKAGGYSAVSKREAKDFERIVIARNNKAQIRRDSVLRVMRPNQPRYESSFAVGEMEAMQRTKARLMGRVL